MDNNNLPDSRLVKYRKRKRTSTFGLDNAIYEQLGLLIDVYKQNFVHNFYFLLGYTGMKNKNYKKIVSSYGLKNPLNTIYLIKSNSLIGFDLMNVAALANLFRIPTTLILNYRLGELESFVPEDYGIYKNMHARTHAQLNKNASVLIPTTEQTVNKKLFKTKRNFSQDSPAGVFDIWSHIKK